MPHEHFLWTLDADWIYLLSETAHLHSRRYGRGPVILVNYLFLYGGTSERQIEQRIQTDMTLRWYVGLDIFDTVPDTVSSLRCAGENQPFGMYSGGCLRKLYGNVSPAEWSADGCLARTLPM